MITPHYRGKNLGLIQEAKISQRDAFPAIPCTRAVGSTQRQDNAKSMKTRLVMVLLALGLSASAYASGNTDLGRISFVKPGAGVRTSEPSPHVKLVVEGAFVSHDKTPLPAEVLIEHVDKLLKANNATSLAIYVREGTKYGDVVRALDTLRKTAAKDIGVSTVEIPAGVDVG